MNESSASSAPVIAPQHDAATDNIVSVLALCPLEPEAGSTVELSSVPVTTSSDLNAAAKSNKKRRPG